MVSERFLLISGPTMGLPCRWIIVITLWTQLGLVSGMHFKDGTVGHLSREDVLLLKDEQDPKCFTRTERDFTCFFETADNGTYDFFYGGVLQGKKRCEMSVQRTEEGTFLHICSFPDSDVLLFLETNLEVVERYTNTSLYQRDVSVEDHNSSQTWDNVSLVLLDAPHGVSLHHNGKAGQLQVSRQSKVPEYQRENVMYRLRYSSEGLGEKITEAKEGNLLDSLVPGEEVQVQVSVKCALTSGAGHWSSWSHPVRAVVPQGADDISLMCFTSDLQNITCQWNGSRYENEYELSYQMVLSDAVGWTEWTACLADSDLTDMCRFHGDEFRKVRVKLNSTSNPPGRTFYTPEFTLNDSIKTAPPIHPRGALQKEKLCLKWEAPLPSLSAHLQYEVGYQIRGAAEWMLVSLDGPETGTCLNVPVGGQYSVKIRAKPTGNVYSGHWSDWSDVITGDSPTSDTLLILCVPISMLITAIILISLFPSYLSRIKLYIWPPVPNLEKVLQGFLTEINGQRWDPPLTAKPCYEETTSSVVEIVSEDEVSQSGTSTQLLSSERGLSRRERVDGSPGSEVLPDYVTLNKDSGIIFPKRNRYVNDYETCMCEKEGVTLKRELIQTCHSCSDDRVSAEPCSISDLLNHSYLPMAESADRCDRKLPAGRGKGNLYTNLPCC